MKREKIKVNLEGFKKGGGATSAEIFGLDIDEKKVDEIYRKIVKDAKNGFEKFEAIYNTEEDISESLRASLLYMVAFTDGSINTERSLESAIKSAFLNGIGEKNGVKVEAVKIEKTANGFHIPKPREKMH